MHMVQTRACSLVHIINALILHRCYVNFPVPCSMYFSQSKSLLLLIEGFMFKVLFEGKVRSGTSIGSEVS